MTARQDLAFALGIARGRPFNCLVQVTNRCNMRCSFCDFWPNGAPPAQELTLADYQRLSDELAGLGCFLVSIEGGEPLLRPDLVEIVRAFARHHLPLLYTNGWYVTERAARDLFAAGLTQVGVSVDYAEPADHDRKRGLPGATERAWRAVELLRDAAPRGDRQVHVMTVLMESNWRQLDGLLRQSRARGVGHCVTLLSTGGFRRGQEGPDRLPPPEAAERFARLWRRYPHLRYFREYFRHMGSFLSGGAMPACRAGIQGFNVDHLGNVAACIEKIDRPVGNVRTEPLARIHERLVGRRDLADGCQQCWTACRGMTQLLGRGGSFTSWRDLAGRMRSS